MPESRDGESAIMYLYGGGYVISSPCSRTLALETYSNDGLGSGPSQLVEEGARSPKTLGEDGRVLPYAYPKVILEAECRPRREHHAALFGEPVGELEGGYVEVVAQEGQ